MKKEQLDQDRVLLAPSGSLDITNSKQYKEAFLDLLSEGFRHVTLDFSNVTFIDASGLSKLLLLQSMLKKRRGGLTIINVHNKNIARMFGLIHLDKAIEIKHD